MASGYSRTAKEIMNNEDYKKYYKEKEIILDEYFQLAVESKITKDLMDPDVLEEINKFSTSEDAWKKLDEVKNLIKLLKEKN